MGKAKDSIFIKAIYTYLLAIVFSAIFSPIAGKIYILIFNPIDVGGLWGWADWWVASFIQNTFFALPFFIPLFVMILVKRKQWLVWLIGALIVFAIFYLGESKESLWFLIFTLAGFLLGWVIKIVYQKFIAKK